MLLKNQNEIHNRYVERLQREHKELLAVAKLAYRKHGLSDDSIGWDELSNKLSDALANAMGNDAFEDWMHNPVPDAATAREGSDE